MTTDPPLEPETSPSGTESPTEFNAVWLHLKDEYRKYQESAKENEEVLATIIMNDGRNVLVKSFGFSGPDFLTTDGWIGSEEVTVYVHPTALQVIFQKKVIEPERVRRVIGFLHGEYQPIHTA